MSLLLDSNVLLWWFDREGRLSARIEDTVEAEPNLFVSVVTPWKLWIKAQGGKLTLPPNLESGFEADAFRLLPPTLDDARIAAKLPAIHRDPFDRMLIAQAMNHRLRIVTADRVFVSYGVDVILV